MYSSRISASPEGGAGGALKSVAVAGTLAKNSWNSPLLRALVTNSSTFSNSLVNLLSVSALLVTS